jgi:hypothetical protein
MTAQRPNNPFEKLGWRNKKQGNETAKKAPVLYPKHYF